MPSTRDPFAPYVAANGHTMVAGRHWSRARQEYIAVHAWAHCTDDCRACRAGGDPSDYCGEEW